jgi:hypothetical protein
VGRFSEIFFPDADLRSVLKDVAAPHLALIVCSALLYFQTKAAPDTF